jgi:hypothetical protein
LFREKSFDIPGAIPVKPGYGEIHRIMSQLKMTLTAFVVPVFLLFASVNLGSASSAIKKSQNGYEQTGTLQKMIVENGSVTMQLDLNGLNGSNSLVARPVTLLFAAAPNSFLPILIFNDLLRGLEPGSIALALQGSSSPKINAPGNLPEPLRTSLKRLTLEKVRSRQGFDLAVRDSNTEFTFFNVKGQEYDYDASAQSFTITGGKLLLSKQFADTLGIPSEAGSWVGTISIGAAMRPIEITQLTNGKAQSVLMPPLQHSASPQTPHLVSGPDVIVGDIEDVDQMGNNGTQVGLAIGTDSCNNGDQPVDWFALPQTDHPVVPQNLYRMSGGEDNQQRFEQIGQSWMKHTFEALEESVCGTCNTGGCQTGTHLCPGCSDPYVSGLNGDQDLIGSRAWVNPFTGSFPSNANDHTGHSHDGVSHRVLVEMSDLLPSGNPGASYFGEAAYISPHEYTWCQSHPTECNMFNNFSYRQFSVTGGPTFFNFSAVSSTVRMQPAIMAWATTGATVQQVEPDPGDDGLFFVGYKVTGPTAGLWHYEYAIFNMNLDRAIRSFEVVFPGFPPNLSNIGFHAPPQHPGWANDGTEGDAGYSSTPWTFTLNGPPPSPNSAVWNCETFAQNQNANAVRWGTLYNFRFDSGAPPADSTANIGFFKTGSPVSVQIQAPFMSDATPTPTPTATPTATATVSPTPTASATATISPTPTPTVTATPTATPRPTPTPRSNPTARPRPTPPPRP